MSTGPRTDEVEGAIRALLAEVGECRRPAARAVLVSPSGRVMRGTPHQARWEYPGGGLDEGERTLEAAVRETREEACCLGVEVPGVPPRGPRRGRAYREPLGFGSPRRDGHGTDISQAAADLLREAAVRLGLGEDEYRRRRYDWFDALGERLEVSWRNEETYHVLALRQELPFRPSRWGWRERRWVDLAEVRRRGEADPHGPTAWLLARGLEGAVAEAARFSRGLNPAGPCL